jgi:hypothetical protein
MADGAAISIGELREALVSAMDLGGAWGQDMHESKKALLRIDGETYPLTRVSAAFTGGSFVVVLDADG